MPAEYSMTLSTVRRIICGIHLPVRETLKLQLQGASFGTYPSILTSDVQDHCFYPTLAPQPLYAKLGGYTIQSSDRLNSNIFHLEPLLGSLEDYSVFSW